MRVSQFVVFDKFVRQLRDRTDTLLPVVLDSVEALLQFTAALLLGFGRYRLARRFARLLDVAAGEGKVVPPHFLLLRLAGFRIAVGRTVDGHVSSLPCAALVLRLRH